MVSELYLSDQTADLNAGSNLTNEECFISRYNHTLCGPQLQQVVQCHRFQDVRSQRLELCILPLLLSPSAALISQWACSPDTHELQTFKQPLQYPVITDTHSSHFLFIQLLTCVGQEISPKFFCGLCNWEVNLRN